MLLPIAMPEHRHRWSTEPVIPRIDQSAIFRNDTQIREEIPRHQAEAHFIDVAFEKYSRRRAFGDYWVQRCAVLTIEFDLRNRKPVLRLNLANAPDRVKR